MGLVRMGVGDDMVVFIIVYCWARVREYMYSTSTCILTELTFLIIYNLRGMSAFGGVCMCRCTEAEFLDETGSKAFRAFQLLFTVNSTDVFPLPPEQKWIASVF